MNNRVQKKDIAIRLARRMGSDENLAEQWIDAFTDTLCDAFKQGDSVTLQGFGGFYVRPERGTWVFRFNPSQKLRAMLGWSSTYKGEV
jgi:DNA-binding protein HU-beta